jgi:hypothetical protein
MPKERGRSTNNQHFCHRVKIGLSPEEKSDRKKSEKEKKRKGLEVSGRLREREGSAGKGAGNALTVRSAEIEIIQG